MLMRENRTCTWAQSTTVRRRRRMMIKGGLEGWKMGRTKFPQPSGIPYQNTNFNNA